jgi:hypothetical protein
MICFSNDDLTSGGNIRVEVSGSLIEDQVTILISLIALHKSEVSSECLLKKISFAIELSDFSRLAVADRLAILSEFSWDKTLLEKSTSTSWGIESGDTSTTCSNLFSEVTLRGKMYFNLPVKILTL